MGNKAKKVKKKLAVRVKGWEDLGGAMESPKIKRSGGGTYRKPGSLNPRK